MAQQTKLTIGAVNGLKPKDFIARYGDVAENAPWVAKEVARSRPFASREEMIAAFAKAIKNVADAAQVFLIRSHPDLATKAKLTPDSRKEQAGAGLDSLTEDEMLRFTDLNAAYKSRFGFPFIFAVKGANKHQILKDFERRLQNTREMERGTAVEHICRIIRFRLEDRIAQ
jgi:2-oxo-4-hydroxy-4-carboxy-5-ureidoimidazoline decarboxylase